MRLTDVIWCHLGKKDGKATPQPGGLAGLSSSYFGTWRDSRGPNHLFNQYKWMFELL